jgi:fumarylacetoacetase
VIDETHHPDIRSWVDSANEPGTDFPIQNLPLGIVRLEPSGAETAAVAVGEEVLLLDVAVRLGVLSGPAREAAALCASGFLNPLMAYGPETRRALRAGLVDALREDSEAGRLARSHASELLVNASEVETLVPAAIGDYSDFYASIEHAKNLGSMFRPDNPLLPNYTYVPIGYHGRASSIVASGTGIVRPSGQTKAETDAAPSFGPTKRLDYELEVGVFVGRGNLLGEPIPIAQAEERMFGLCLVNDWSARDVQGWEYQPLGPFLAKNFATTVSPWVVTMDALEPFRAPAFRRADGDPAPLPYLSSPTNETTGGVDIQLEVWLRSAKMRAAGTPAYRLSHVRFTQMYWTLAQLVTHHASNGCNLNPGDLLASGTVSGAAKDSRGCMQELTWRGTEPVTLPSGELRRFLEDGDEVIMRGFCERDGFTRIGFGECRGTVLSALASAGHTP